MHCATPAHVAHYLESKGWIFLAIMPATSIMTALLAGSLKPAFERETDQMSRSGGGIWPLETFGITIVSRLGVGATLDAMEDWMLRIPRTWTTLVYQLAGFAYGGYFFIRALLSRVDPEASPIRSSGAWYPACPTQVFTRRPSL